MPGKERDQKLKPAMNIQDRIWNYLRSDRKGTEANSLERESLTDPFLYEALEGLEGMEADHERIVADLLQQIRQHHPVQHRKLANRLVWIAAAVLMGGIAVWLLYLPETPLPMAQSTLNEDTLTAAPIALAQPVEEKEEEKAYPLVVSSATQTVQEKASQENRSRMPEAQLETGQAFTEEMEEECDILVEQQASVRKKENPPRKVEGIVRDKQGKPLAGVMLIAEQARLGTVTDTDGHFRLTVPDSVREIQASFIGMEKVACALPDSGSVQITMKESRQNLSELQVTGYAATANRKIALAAKAVAHENPLADFTRYVTDSLRYPEDARLQGTEGKVVLSVHFNKKKRPSRIKVVKKLSPSCDQEAIRLVEAYPGPWQPAERYMTLEIPFRLPRK